jgi:N-acylglucosamine 2-epimerase
MTELRELRTFLYDHLVRAVMPFWTRFGIDPENGGLFTYLAPDGTLLDRRKSMTSNTRALFTFAALVNRIEDRNEWRNAANSLYRFLVDHGRDENGWWIFQTDEKGNVQIGENSIIVDAFAIGGLVEYYHISHDPEPLRIAKETYRKVQERLAHPGTYKTSPYPTPPGMRPQREAMQFSLMFAELGHAIGDAEILESGLRYGRDVLDLFYRPDNGILLEYLGLDNRPMDTPAGRCMVPGHAIETLWFQMHIFRNYAPNEVYRAEQAARALKPCLEKGWDPEFGGILLGIDVEGRKPVYWKLADLKRWWPVTEAMPACLLAYEILGEPWCLEWYWRIHEWAFARFPDRANGDWIQNLIREGRPILSPDDLTDVEPEARAWIECDMKVKDPFHLPRGLIVSINTLDRILKQSKENQNEG